MTGEKWIDGKLIYRKVIHHGSFDISANGGNTSASILPLSDSIDWIVFAFVIAKSNVNFLVNEVVPTVSLNNNTYQLWNYSTVRHTAIDSYVIFNYTKSNV